MISRPTLSARLQLPSLVLGLIVCLSQPVLAQPTTDWEPRPFDATFLVKRNNKEAANSQMRLESLAAAGEYRFFQKTRGSKGMVGLLGGAVNESSSFFWDGQFLIPREFKYRRKLPLFSRKRQIIFDLTTGSARGKDSKHGRWQQAFTSGDLDHLLVNLALGQDLASNRPMNHTIIDKNQRKHWQFELIGEEVLELPYGPVHTLHLKRSRAHNKRESHLWLAPDLNYLPAKISHREKGNDLETLLVSHRFLAINDTPEPLLENSDAPDPDRDRLQ